MADNSKGTLVFIGSYTSEGKEEGVYVYRLHPETGELTFVSKANGGKNPSFLALHPNGKFLYTVCEIADFEGKKAGGMSALSIDREKGTVSLLNQESSVEGGPCYVSVDHEGRYAFAANYGGGGVAMLPIGEDGRLKEASDYQDLEGSSVNPERQKAPHTHSVIPTPDNRFVMAADLGLDKVMIYRLDSEKDKLVPNDPPFAKTPAGAGPRHIDFHPNKRFAYVITEMHNTMEVYAYDGGKGSLEHIQTISTLPEGFEGRNSCAEVRASKDGKFVYGSNRGHDSIVIYRADENTGKLTLVGHQSVQGKNPRNFNLDPSGDFLLCANQDTDNVVVFKVDRETGKLTPAGHEAKISKPVCVKYLAE